MNTKQHPSNTRLKSPPRGKRAFTLIEMIGVLAIIAILAVVIVPKVFDAIRNSRINGTLISLESVRTATVDFVAKYGTLPTTGGNSRIDDLLMEEGLMDERFQSRVGPQADVYAAAGASWSRNSTSGKWTSSGGSSQSQQTRIICKTSNTSSPESADGRNYQIDGSNDLPSGARVVSAVINDVPILEARELSKRLDSEELSTDDGEDGDGKVVYDEPSGSGTTDVYIYLLHQ